MTRKMKDSGVEWIGEMPEDWDVRKLGALIKNFDYLRQPISANKRKGGPYPYWGAGSITDYVEDYIFDEELILLGEDGAPFFDEKRDVAFYVNEKIWVNNHIHVLKPRNQIYIKFLLHYLNNVDYGSYINGSILNKLTQSNMNRIEIVFPLISKQKLIGNFLDEKTREIDNIISKTNKAIEEYKEYKQSLITETVTRGLDENTPMKDSGVDWIGNIPKHWDVTRPTRICEIIRGNSSFQKTDLEDEGYYLALQYGRTYRVDIVDETYNHYVDKTFYKSDQIVEKGDTILISTSETMEDLGHSCFYNRFDIGLLGGEQMCLKPNKTNVIDKFLYYATKYFRIELNQYATGLKVYRFRLDDLKRINIIIPPIEEQNEIVKFLDRQLPLIDEIISTKQKLITEMEAYKRSLIYEAVTGKREVE